MKNLFSIDAMDDGTWLRLDGPTKHAALRLESAFTGPVMLAAVREVRQAILTNKAELDRLVDIAYVPGPDGR